MFLKTGISDSKMTTVEDPSEFESVPIPLQVQGEVCWLERTFAEAVLSDEKVPFKSPTRQGKYLFRACIF